MTQREIIWIMNRACKWLREKSNIQVEFLSDRYEFVDHPDPDYRYVDLYYTIKFLDTKQEMTDRLLYVNAFFNPKAIRYYSMNLNKLLSEEEWQKAKVQLEDDDYMTLAAAGIIFNRGKAQGYL